MFDYQLPVAKLVQECTDWLTNTFSGLFNVVQHVGNSLMTLMTDTLLFVPPLLMIVIMTLLAYVVSHKKWSLTALTGVGLLFIYNQQLWSDLMNTVTLVLTSSIVSILIGVPLGIWMAKKKRVAAIINPVLDFMQTMPSFVYLIPAVAFFGIGMVPGVFASVIFALPPTVRMTHLAIKQIPSELVEASDSFGGTPRQKLFKVELPLAKSTIFAGINQTIMLALSMVVTASMIGAPGLGRGVLSALQHADIGSGFVSGVSLVILAMIIDRFTQRLNQPITAKAQLTAADKKRQKYTWYAVLVGVIVLIVTKIASASFTETKETVNLGYVQWDSEVASTNVIGEVLKEMGYEVTLTPLDNAVLWQSVANGDVDVSVSAWLPTTHGALYEQYKDDIVDLGANLENVKSGLVVPSYMSVNSIADLTDQAGKQITGIEPGAGIMTTAQKTIDSYANLSGWTLNASSTGAMTIALERAIKNKEDIVITGWSPHWMFSKYDLKFLEDPQKTMGESESIHTITKKNLATENPTVNKVLDQFNWTQEDMESVMLAIHDGASPEQAAKDWIKQNPEKVAAWKK